MALSYDGSLFVRVFEELTEILEDIQLTQRTLPSLEEPSVDTLSVIGMTAGQPPHLLARADELQAHGALPSPGLLSLPQPGELEMSQGSPCEELLLTFILLQFVCPGESLEVVEEGGCEREQS